MMAKKKAKASKAKSRVAANRKAAEARATDAMAYMVGWGTTGCIVFKTMADAERWAARWAASVGRPHTVYRRVPVRTFTPGGKTR